MSPVRLLDHWSPPDGAGAPVACLATTFTFDADFFTQDCLARFLSLSTVAGEGDSISSIAAVLEEEDRLSEAQVSVLVDRSSPAEKRNLRWDVLPVAVPRGLLHAKVAVLIWERSARVILGSANLTAAGYRRQIELALAIELNDDCRVPRPVVDELVAELRHLADLAPGPTDHGPKTRALSTIDLLAQRIADIGPPSNIGGDLRLAIAPARPGVNPLERLSRVWRGPQPLSATVLSPFWDDLKPAPAVDAVRSLLTGRPANRRHVTLVAGVDPFTGVVHAPPSLASQRAEVVAFEPPDKELRALHAKLILIESDEWTAALVGSSNATTAGLGLQGGRGHHELNVWIGCPSGSRTAKHLRSLAGAGDPISIDDERWEAVPDEDEPTAPELPPGFIACVVDARPPARVALEFNSAGLPKTWDVRTPGGALVLDDSSWSSDGSPPVVDVVLPDKLLPAYLVVHWTDDKGANQATWTANIEDRSALPPPSELADLPVSVLLAALASTRPLPVALEHELRRCEHVGGEPSSIDLDPLHRFDDSGLLMKRMRHRSLALWRLQERLGRPTSSMDALHWRLHGPFGVVTIADGLVAAAADEQTLPGEANFLLAELALTVSAVDWKLAVPGLDQAQVGDLVTEVLVTLEDRRGKLEPSADAALDEYVRDALQTAQR